MTRESQFLTSILNEGRLDGEVRTLRRETLAFLRDRLANPVPEGIRLAVEGTNDPAILSKWLRLAATSSSLEEFTAGLMAGASTNGG